MQFKIHSFHLHFSLPSWLSGSSNAFAEPPLLSDCCLPVSPLSYFIAVFNGDVSSSMLLSRAMKQDPLQIPRYTGGGGWGVEMTRSPPSSEGGACLLLWSLKGMTNDCQLKGGREKTGYEREADPIESIRVKALCPKFCCTPTCSI